MIYIKTNRIFSLLLLLAMVMGCRKPKPCPPTTECVDLPTPGTGSGLLPTLERNQYKFPCFNPDNPDELAYIHVDNSSGTSRLMKYHIPSGTRTELAQVSTISQPRWSRSGWIAVDGGYNILLIGENGGSQMTFTTNPANLYPVWNDVGDELIWSHNPDQGSQWYTLRQSIGQQSPPDTIRSRSCYPCDVKDGKLLLNGKTAPGGQAYYGYYDLSGPPPYDYDDFITLRESEGTIMGLCWSHDAQAVYAVNLLELHKVDANTGVLTQLLPFCNARQYNTVSPSPDGRYLVGERVVVFPVYDTDCNYTNKFGQQSLIYLIDLQTMEETKINLE